MSNTILSLWMLYFCYHVVDSLDLNTSTLTYFWPFCNDTMAFEINYLFEAEKPKKGSCPLLDIGPPQLGFNVFLFDIDPRNYARVRTNRYLDPWDDFGLVFTISPEADQGVIMEYIADKIIKNTVNSWTIELQKSFLLVTIVYDDDTQVVGQSNTRLELWSWTVVAISRIKSTGELIIQVGQSVQSVSAVNATERTFNGIGRISVSYSSNVSKPVYQGRFCCLALFTSSIAKYTDPRSIVRIFNESIWPNPAPTGVKTPCALGVTYAGPTVVKLWPLQTDNASSFGYDVIDSVAPLAPANVTCSRSRDIFDYTSSTVSYFDGSKFSYLMQPVSVLAALTDMTVAIFVRPDPPVEGVLWDYVAFTQSTGALSRFSLRFDAGLVTVQIFNSSGLCCSLQSSLTVPPDNWSIVSLIYSTASNSISLLVNDSSISKVINCTRITTLNLNGTMTVGQGQDFTLPYDVGYHGSAACLAVFQGVLNASSATSTLRERCVTLNKVVVAKALCNDTSTNRIAGFKLAADDSKPDVGLAPMSSYFSRSLLDCTNRCTRQKYCRSFTFRRNETYGDCFLYDYVTKQGLKQDIGNRYYVISAM